MNRFTVLAMSLAVGVSGCSKDFDDDAASAPAKPTFTADLRPANESAADRNAEQSGSGTATVVFDVTKDAAGNITGGTASFTVNLPGSRPGRPSTSPTSITVRQESTARSSSARASRPAK